SRILGLYCKSAPSARTLSRIRKDILSHRIFFRTGSLRPLIVPSHSFGVPPLSPRLHPVAHHRFAAFCHDGFGVELDAFDGVFAVADAHDLAFLCFCRDFEAVGKRLALDDERVVAGSGERIRQALEDSAVEMADW